MSTLSRVEIYRDRENQWRFRAVALNGEIVAVSEGYHNRQDTVDEAVRLWPDAEIEEEGEGESA